MDTAIKLLATTAVLFPLLSAHAEEELLLIEDDSEEVLLIDEISLEDPEEETGDLIYITDDADHIATDTSESESPLFQVDKLWTEYSYFTDADSATDHRGYLHGQASFNWNPADNWEVKISARVDGFSESGDNHFDDIDLDYDEIYIRYKTQQSILTLGTQKVIWGRIDEFPPTDRLSTQDFRRFVLDSLEDRRLASPAIRYEYFLETGKLDFVLYPDFREAELPDRDSSWFPVNIRTGEILGLETTAAVEALVSSTPIRENTPNSEGGAGLRYSSLGSDIDYAVTLQRGRSSVPYFAFNPATGIIEGRYPRSWVAGGDVGFEALGGTLKLEGSWLSDTPVTREDGRFTTTESLNWGIALELFPGDGDARLNLQVVAQNLLNISSVLDREDIYTFNGSYEVPFGDNSWRAKTRFYIGLNDKDIYLNPELAYTGLDAQEIYLTFHYFDGDNGTPGGFYEDNSSIALGWRITL